MINGRPVGYNPIRRRCEYVRLDYNDCSLQNEWLSPGPFTRVAERGESRRAKIWTDLAGKPPFSTGVPSQNESIREASRAEIQASVIISSFDFLRSLTIRDLFHCGKGLVFIVELKEALPPLADTLSVKNYLFSTTQK